MLHARNLTLTIAGRTLCASLDAELKAGENWVILGANGSGKTTLLHALAGLRAPDAGQIRLEGTARSAASRRARAPGASACCSRRPSRNSPPPSLKPS
jgi:iron complex transport system ATP-binding protein